MNTDALIAHSQTLVQSAVQNQEKLHRLIQFYHRIGGWLVDHGLPVTASSIRAYDYGLGFDLVYMLPNDSLIAFATLQKEFWDYVIDQVGLDDDIFEAISTGSELLPSTVFHEDSWGVVVIPHPDICLDDAPDFRFWESVAVSEADNERCRQMSWRDERLNEVYAALPSA
jgi:hypothetical protein